MTVDQDGVLKCGELGRVAGARILVMIGDSAQKCRPPRETLARLYGLGAQQAELAALLAEGRDFGAAADALAMSRNTARAHLRAIFAKTGTHRQGELARLLVIGATRGDGYGFRHVR